MNQVKMGGFISKHQKGNTLNPSQLAKKSEITDATSSSLDIVLELKNISKVYDAVGVSTVAVNNVNFEVAKGNFIGIMGASGSGKSSLLNMIATIDKSTEGTIEIDGQDIGGLSPKDLAVFRREHLGFIFQEYNLLDTLTIYENIVLSLTIKAFPKENVKSTIMQLADRLEIVEVLNKFPYEVSGGQRQRCACARAIVTNPNLILADEPTGALDSHSAKQLLETLTMLRMEYGATILMVTHDALSASYCDKIFFMHDGEIRTALERAEQSKQEFFTNILDTMTNIRAGESYVS